MIYVLGIFMLVTSIGSFGRFTEPPEVSREKGLTPKVLLIAFLGGCQFLHVAFWATFLAGLLAGGAQ